MSAIKFSVCIEMLFTELPFLDRIDAAADTGFQAVEFWGWRGKDMEAIAARLQKTGMKLAGFTTDCGGDLCNPDVHRDWVRGAAESIDAAVEIGAPSLIVTTGNELEAVPREEQHKSIVEGLRSIAPYAEEKNVTLCIEPLNTAVDHAGYYLVTSEEGFQVVDEAGSDNIKLLYDIYHQQITEGHLIPTITGNINRIGHFHVADVPGRNEPGTGEINYENVFRAIGETGYDRYVGLEFRPIQCTVDALTQVLKIAGQV